MLRTLNEADQAELVLMLLDIKDLERNRKKKKEEQSACHNKNTEQFYEKTSECIDSYFEVLEKQREVIDFLDKKLLG